MKLPWKRRRVIAAGIAVTCALLAAPVAAGAVTTADGSEAAEAADGAKSTRSAKATGAAERADGPDATAGWNDFDCKPSAAHPRPVVLVHGTFANGVDNWLILAPQLAKKGYCVFSLDYGKLPNVPFINGLGPVEKSAGELAAYVDKVRSATGASKVDLVGHSQGGGLMPRYYLKFNGGASKVNSLVGIAPSNHGTTLSNFTKLLPYFPGIEDLLNENTPALTDQVVGSEVLQKLNAGGDTVPGVKYTVIATQYDEVVTPWETQYLKGPGVRNVKIQDVCPDNKSEHVLIGTVDGDAFHEVSNALDPEHATPNPC